MKGNNKFMLNDIDSNSSNSSNSCCGDCDEMIKNIDFDNEIYVNPPAPIIPRPSRKKDNNNVDIVNEKNSDFGNKNGKIKPKDEARKARNRASAERSRQKRLMYTLTLEEKLSSIEKRNKFLEIQNQKLEKIIEDIAAGNINAKDALLLSKSSNSDDELPIDIDSVLIDNNKNQNFSDGFKADYDETQAPFFGDNIFKENYNVNALTEVISGSERSNFFNLFISWLSGNLMLIVFQMKFSLINFPRMISCLKHHRHHYQQQQQQQQHIKMKTSQAYLMNPSLIGGLALKMKMSHQVKGFALVSKTYNESKRNLCNHRIK